MRRLPSSSFQPLSWTLKMGWQVHPSTRGFSAVMWMLVPASPAGQCRRSTQVFLSTEFWVISSDHQSWVGRSLQGSAQAEVPGRGFALGFDPWASPKPSSSASPKPSSSTSPQPSSSASPRGPSPQQPGRARDFPRAQGFCQPGPRTDPAACLDWVVPQGHLKVMAGLSRCQHAPG